MNDIDDIKLIEKIDFFNMRKLLHEFPHQMETVIQLMTDFELPSAYKKVKNIIVCGLGGSSVGGDLLKNFLRDKIHLPIIVNRSYTLPHWVDENSLLMCVSYSGNTEETLSVYAEGRKRRSKIVVITSGGKLSELVKEDGWPIFRVPEVGIPPRTALGYLFLPQLLIIRKLQLADFQDGELSELVNTLKQLTEEIDVSVPKEKNISKKLAEEIYQSVPLVYTTSDFLEGVGIRWKTQLNENSKNPVYAQFFSELDHNEIMGWEGAKNLTKQFSVILLRDKNESERMRRRMNITSSLIKEKPKKILEVYSKGEGLLARMLSLIYIGDYVSFYLGILNNVDPTEINYISDLKKKLSS